MPAIYTTRMLVVAIVLCSALAGKASAQSVHNDRVLQSIWYDGENTFNITMDACISGVTVVGIYQFANGTNKNDTTFGEIELDLLVFGFRSSRTLRHQRYATQLIANAQLAKNEIEAFIYDREFTVSGTDHTGLRRLLDVSDGYWAAVINREAELCGCPIRNNPLNSFEAGSRAGQPIQPRYRKWSTIDDELFDYNVLANEVLNYNVFANEFRKCNAIAEFRKCNVIA
ncbi:hypothetical protein JMJ35_010742 [Cladonia borealis]|uniref:Uncharacterized protein n=1 Tax=Cladonia borealis TaxID=184061 RepID=A0AA39QPP0_9LECA|nr:hypothetical protein JMJ35_010742 [Cladonia borealis]